MPDKTEPRRPTAANAGDSLMMMKSHTEGTLVVEGREDRVFHFESISTFRPSGPRASDSAFIEKQLDVLDEKCGDPCIDSHRAVHTAEAGWEVLFDSMRSCCGECETKVVNPETGNEFKIGHNCGH